MKVAIVFALFVATALAAPQQKPKEPEIQIVEFKSETNADGSYDFGYKGSDGTSRSEQGQQKQIGDAAGTAITGVIEFTSPEGQKFTLRYIADENGFQPIGDHLPKAQ